MGINISLQKVVASTEPSKHMSWKDHPTWDDMRYAGDRDFMTWMQYLPHSYIDDAKEIFRPDDIAAWRAALPADRPNPERFLEMFDILEREPEFGIHISY